MREPLTLPGTIHILCLETWKSWVYWFKDWNGEYSKINLIALRADKTWYFPWFHLCVYLSVCVRVWLFAFHSLTAFVYIGIREIHTRPESLKKIALEKAAFLLTQTLPHNFPVRLHLSCPLINKVYGVSNGRLKAQAIFHTHVKHISRLCGAIIAS